MGLDGKLVGQNIKQLASHKSAMSYMETEKEVASRLYKRAWGPIFIRGSIYGNKIEAEPIRLALSVNDVVENMSKTFSHLSGDTYDFEFFLPASSYSDQENVIRIYEIDGNQNDGYSLALLKGERRMKYAMSEIESGAETLRDDSGKHYQTIEGYL
ncbi:MAG: hypothetical protein JKY88_18575 [Pseudomonadales bacterium]|nr:hypothetical protein [Pseudomonadales bacterium]